MKKKLNIVILIAALLVGFLSAFWIFYPAKNEASILKTVLEPDFSVVQAPSESVTGTIDSMSGDVFWQGRIATQSSLIKTTISLQQGETIQTGENGEVALHFPNEALIKINPKTEIDFIQTLPVNFVVNIASGSAEFTKTSNTPVSIRSLHLLTKIKEGKINIKIDDVNPLITLDVISGSVTLGYNDLYLVSHTLNFEAGQSIIFNDSTRNYQ